MSLERLAGEVMGQERKVEIRTPELAPRWRWRASGRDGHTDRVSEQLACGFRRRRHDRGRSEQPPRTATMWLRAGVRARTRGASVGEPPAGKGPFRRLAGPGTGARVPAERLLDVSGARAGLNRLDRSRCARQKWTTAD